SDSSARQQAAQCGKERVVLARSAHRDTKAIRQQRVPTVYIFHKDPALLESVVQPIGFGHAREKEIGLSLKYGDTGQLRQRHGEPAALVTYRCSLLGHPAGV